MHLTSNDVIPTFDEANAKIDLVLTDNGREFCGRPDLHPYELFLLPEEIQHTTTKLKWPQSDGFLEPFHRHKTWLETIEEVQVVLDDSPRRLQSAPARPGAAGHQPVPSETASPAEQNRNCRRRRKPPSNPDPLKPQPDIHLAAASARWLPFWYNQLALADRHQSFRLVMSCSIARAPALRSREASPPRSEQRQTLLIWAQ